MKRILFSLCVVATGALWATGFSFASPAEEEWDAANAETAAALGRNDLPAARQAAEKAALIAENGFGSGHMKTAVAWRRLAELQRLTGDAQSSGRTWDRAARSWTAELGAQHPYSAEMLVRSAEDLAASGDAAGAVARLREALLAQKSYFGDRHTAVASTLRLLARVQRDSGDAAGARQSELEAAEILLEAGRAGYGRALEAFRVLAGHASEEGDLVFARAQLKRVLDAAPGMPHPPIRPLASAWALNGDLAAADKDVILAETSYRKALELLGPLEEASREDRLILLYKLRELHQAWGREDAAAQAAEDARALEAAGRAVPNPEAAG